MRHAFMRTRHQVARMLAGIMVTFGAALVVPAAWADDPFIDQVQVRQRWPWNGLVDVDYRLVADGPCDVLLKVSWTGCAEPIVFTNGLFNGELTGSSVSPGVNHFVFDPAAHGVSDRSLANFKVELESAVSADWRKWLVLDLIKTTWSFTDTEPEGGWNVDAYKQTKMVFRLVPAGIYELGNSEEELVRFNATAAQRKVMSRRRVRISNDYYLAIFPMSAAQMSSARYQHMYDTSRRFYIKSYDTFRGGAVADDVNWPTTGHKVKTDCLIDIMRKQLKLPTADAVIDFPTETQWEVAMRAGTTTIYPNGGTVEDSDETLKDYLDALGVHGDEGTGLLGQCSPNAWGFYDFLGIVFEWALDGYSAKAGEEAVVRNPDFRVPGQVVDPIGSSCTADDSLRRVTCNIGWNNGVGLGTVPSYREARSPGVYDHAFRPCINLKPLVK